MKYYNLEVYPRYLVLNQKIDVLNFLFFEPQLVITTKNYLIHLNVFN